MEKAELVLMVKLLAVFTGKPVDPTVPVTHAVSNVICALILGHRFSIEDKKFLRLVEAVDDISAFTNSISFYVRIMIFYIIVYTDNVKASGWFYNKNECWCT